MRRRKQATELPPGWSAVMCPTQRVGAVTHRQSIVEEEVENPATPMPEASPTSPEEEEAPHLPDAPPARILRHVDHIELMLIDLSWEHYIGYIGLYTPRKINIEPENDGLEDNFHFPGVYSQVPC